ncbi:MAG: hypothetical protein R3212_01205 [Xanthomonadales bacterium]|nr:hypothetical protein [Xanthomonadales bacterium]
MMHVILVFGALIFVIGATVLVKPELVFGHIRRHSDSLGIHVVAVVVRLALGWALIVYSAESRFPVTLQVLGWLTVVVAVTLAVMGRSNFTRLIHWAMSLVDRFGRIAGALAMVLGGFLVYAVY